MPVMCFDSSPARNRMALASSGGLLHQQAAQEVGVEHAADVVLRGVQHGARPVHGGVVYEHVHASPLLGRCNRCPGRALVRDVACHESRAAVAAAARVAGDDHDARTFFNEKPYCRLADAGRAAGDDGDLASEAAAQALARASKARNSNTMLAAVNEVFSATS